MYSVFGFVFAVCLRVAFTNHVNMMDSEKFSYKMYDCEESIQWQKYCEVWDFTIGNCRPWRLDACQDPFIQHRLSPCYSYMCQLLDQLPNGGDETSETPWSPSRKSSSNSKVVTESMTEELAPSHTTPTGPVPADHRAPSSPSGLRDLQQELEKQLNDTRNMHEKLDTEHQQLRHIRHLLDELLGRETSEKKSHTLPRNHNNEENKASKKEQDQHQQRKKKKHNNRHGHRHGHHHRHRQQRLNHHQQSKKHHQASSTLDINLTAVTEATIRRMATDVAKNYFQTANQLRDQTWKQESESLGNSLAEQKGIINKLQAKLYRQDQSLAEVQANVSAFSAFHLDDHYKKQEEAFLALQQELYDVQRQQVLQEAQFWDIEYKHQQEYQSNEKQRLDVFFREVETERVSSFLAQLNLSNLGSVDVMENSNGTNIFIFPRPEAVRANSSRFLHLNLTAHDEICFNPNGTKSRCKLDWGYRDPCIRYQCPSLCTWNEDDCKNFEPTPPSLQCPYAKCELMEEDVSLLWLWSLVPISGGILLGVAVCCYCRQRSNNSGAAGAGENRPLLERLRLRQRLGQRIEAEAVPLQPLPRAASSGEATPVSIDSDDHLERPIVREPRVRCHRLGGELHVTLENETYQPARVSPRSRGYGRHSQFQTISLDRMAASRRPSTPQRTLRGAASAQGLRSSHWQDMLASLPLTMPSAPEEDADVDLAMEASELAGSGSPPRPQLIRSPPPPYDISTGPLPAIVHENENNM